LAGCGNNAKDGKGDAAPPPRTIAFLRAVASGTAGNQASFLEELAQRGYVEGKNLTLLAKDAAEVHPDPADATATVRRWATEGADVIVALSTTGAQAAAVAATPDLAVLFLVNDPVAGGLLTDERHPPGRLTGVTFRVPADRTLDVARRAFPAVTTFGVIYPPADPAAPGVREAARTAASGLGIKIVEAPFATGPDVSGAVRAVKAQGAGAIWALNTPTTFRFIAEIGKAAEQAALPVITNSTTPIAVLTLQPDVPHLYRQMARQAIRLFAGTPVSAVPVENPAQFELEVNLVRAGALGLTIPSDVVDSAEKVIRP
jgi:putative ABC transport system substrate-binding protein